MPFIGNKPSAVPLTSADIADSIITSAKIVDATIANADIANSTINLTTKVTGTLPLTNGGTGLATLGTAAQELRVNSGATALEYYTPTVASSDFVLLATTDASSSSSVSFDGYFSSTYKNYKVMFSSVKPSTNQYFYMRARQSNADVTSSLYYGAGSGRNQYYLAPDLSQEQSNFGNNIFSGGTALTLWDFSYYNGADSNRQVNSATYSSVNGSFEIFDPLSTSTWKQLHGKISYRGTGNAGASSFGITYMDMALLFQASTGSALSGFTFYPSTGTFTSGTFKLYGIK